MDAEKYNRHVTLFCPTCGNSEFKEEEGSEIVECTNCRRKLTREDLIKENGENISEHISEMKKEIVADVTREFKETFKKALGGSRFIKIG